MGYIEDLIAARDKWAAELAAQVPPPGYHWPEYAQFALEMLKGLNEQIAAAQAAAQQEQAAAEGEQISGAWTP